MLAEMFPEAVQRVQDKIQLVSAVEYAAFCSIMRKRWERNPNVPRTVFVAMDESCRGFLTKQDVGSLFAINASFVPKSRVMQVFQDCTTSDKERVRIQLTFQSITFDIFLYSPRLATATLNNCISNIKIINPQAVSMHPPLDVHYARFHSTRQAPWYTIHYFHLNP